MAISLCLQLPPAVYAENGQLLKPETASMDVSGSSNPITPTPTPTPTPAPEHATLFGSARKHQDALQGEGTTDASQNPPLDAAASQNDVKLQAEKAAADAFKLAAQKLSTGQKLSAEDYRALGAGCAGYESDRTFFQNIAKVTIVYRGSPAEAAGIRRGDKVIDNAPDNAQAIAHPTVEQWTVSFDRAGTPVDVTVLRHGQPVKLTLIRMNIEDIQEDKYRHQWEQIIRELGYPKGGTFSGTSIHNLSPDGQNQ